MIAIGYFSSINYREKIWFFKTDTLLIDNVRKYKIVIPIFHNKYVLKVSLTFILS